MQRSKDLPGEVPEHDLASNVKRHTLDSPNQKQTILRNPVASIFESQSDRAHEIITVNSKDSLPKAFQTLINYNILSVPVYDRSARKYLGFLDMVDIVTHALLTLQASQMIGGETPLLFESNTRFSNTTCGSVCDLSHRNAWKPVEAKAPLAAAIDLMVEWKVHRIPVLDSEGNLSALVTQSQVVKTIHRNIGQFKDLASTTVATLQLGYTDVHSVFVDTLAIDAFKLMHDKKVSALAVVSQGKLVGNISVSDLKLIQADGKYVGRLFLKVSEFLQLNQLHKSENASNELPNPICVTPTATFEEVVTKLVTAKVHRVFVVDKQAAPIGVISLAEILKAVRDASK